MRPGRVVPYVVGLLTAFAGAAMLLPAAVSFSYGEAAAWGILASAVSSAAVGGLLYRASRPGGDVHIRDGFAIVTLGWIAVGLAGSLPYLLTGSVDSFTRAFFESMSGLTTTGATIVTEIDTLPRGVVLWRSLTQWLGGMGIIVLSVAILPLLGVGGMQLMQAEIPGLAPDRLRPRVRQTASLLWGVYILLTFAEAVLLWLGGMTPFDAVNHALTTMATGGFSTEDASVGAFESPFIEYVIAAFMVLAGINFTLHYSALTGRWRAVRRNTELRVYLALLAIATATLTLVTWLPGTIERFEPAFRAGLFQTASIMTTTGYATADYETWAPAARTILFLLMLVGGCAGSTAGSVKVLRYLLVAKEARISLKRLIHPAGVFVYKMHGKTVSEDVLANVSGFLLLYMGILGAGVVTLNLLGVDVATAVGAAAATLGNVGPGFGLVGPTETYAPLPDLALWVLAFLMLVGRLEIFTVLILFTRTYWRS
ncbi:MAG TPA: TrkH family potassium uptake protein [Gemmatimonadota bacterium]|nr:TrkH family potassium uptake protein [Gemmatimonadota bacterium]